MDFPRANLTVSSPSLSVEATNVPVLPHASNTHATTTTAAVAPAAAAAAPAVDPTLALTHRSAALQKRFRKSWGDWFDLPAVPTHPPIMLPPSSASGVEQFDLEARKIEVETRVI